MQASETKILPLNSKDIPAIVKIHKKCVSTTNAQKYPKEVIEEWLDQINEDNVRSQLNSTEWLKLEKNKEIIGFCQYDLEDQELYQIQILPEYQGKGYGSTLYSKIERNFLEKDCRKIGLFATLNAIPFYKSKRFIEIEKVEFPLEKTTIQMMKMVKKLSC